MRYESSRKHKEPWQRGRRGALCPKEIDEELAYRLLAESELADDVRYAAHDGRAYCARQHGQDIWHGYPSVGSECRNASGASGSPTAASVGATFGSTGIERSAR